MYPKSHHCYESLRDETQVETTIHPLPNISTGARSPKVSGARSFDSPPMNVRAASASEAIVTACSLRLENHIYTSLPLSSSGRLWAPERARVALEEKGNLRSPATGGQPNALLIDSGSELDPTAHFTINLQCLIFAVTSICCCTSTKNYFTFSLHN
jgi:hypothetical protein